MRDVVVRLEACVFVEGARNDENSYPDDELPTEPPPPATMEAIVQRQELEILELKDKVRMLEMFGPSGKSPIIRGKTVTGLHIRARLGIRVGGGP